jgi:YfiH family protein
MFLSRAGLSDNTGAMSDSDAGFATAPPLAESGWLVHGFGRAGWDEETIRTWPAFRGFRPVVMRQLHSDIIHRLEGTPEGKLEGDALMTDVPGLLLIVRTADCLPVLLVDKEHRAVAAVHCGWRGTEKRSLEKAVLGMTRAYGSEPGKLLAALGPCIGASCYEVGPEVRQAFERAGFPRDVFMSIPSRSHKGGEKGGGNGGRRADKRAHGRRHNPKVSVPFSSAGEAVSESTPRPLLDLRRANIWLLEGLGVNPEAIWTSDACTHCDPGLLSYRRNKGEPRRMYNFIGIRAS